MLDFANMELADLGQVLGLLLSFLGFFIYYARTRQGILCAKLVTDVCFTIQQIMIGALTGAIINAIAIFREVVFYHRKNYKWASHRFWLYFFLVVMACAPILTWAGPVSLLPAVGSGFSVVAFYCSEPRHTRILGLVSMALWLAYSILIPNYGNILSLSIQAVAAILGLIRDYRQTHPKAPDPMS